MKMKKFVSSIVLLSLLLSSVAVTPKETDAADATLLNTYGVTFERIGTCINPNQLRDNNTMNVVKNQYNSVTLENDMKPDSLMNGWRFSTISLDEARNRGYYIPDDYPESVVPALNFGTMDSVMQTCYNAGIGLRGHTLVWHSQTPNQFFRQGYNGNNGYVSKEVMNKRLEFYVKSVLKHTYESKYGTCVYAWDVVNEHFHNNGNGGWRGIYGDEGSRSEYISNAFKYAYEELDEFGLAGKVGLFYNDFNTYQVSDNIVSLVNYVNRDKKYCDGVGMQSHLTTSYPSVNSYVNTVKKFLDAGFEVQITELDIGNNGQEDQANYVYNLCTELLKLKKAGRNITAFVWWGVSDERSWRSSTNPLLFSNINTPKQSYTKAMQAYTEVIGEPGEDLPLPVRVEAEAKPSPTPLAPDAYEGDAEIEYTYTKINIDGLKDDIWNHATEIPMEYYSGEKGDTSASVRLFWDSEYFYVLVDVKDPVLDKSSSNAWWRDGIELYFDEDHSGESSYDNNSDAFQFRFTGLSDDGSTAGTCAFASTGSNASGRYSLLTNNAKYSVTDGGYMIECAVPFYNTPIENGVVGFEMTVMDCSDGERNNEIWVFGPDKHDMYQNPALFGTVKLVASSLPAPTASPSPTPKPTATPKPTPKADVEVNYTDSSIVVDGFADSVWSGVSGIPYAYYSNSRGDTEGSVKLLWNKDALYGFIDVTDPEIDAAGNNDYQRDGVEVFFDEDVSRETSYNSNADAFQYRFTGFESDGARTSAFASAGSEAAARYDGRKFEYTITDKGYSIEFSIPFYKFKVGGDIVGFESTLMDCSGGTRNNEIWLFGEGKGNLYQNPSLFGVLKLSDKTGSAPTASPTPGTIPTSDPLATPTRTPGSGHTASPTSSPDPNNTPRPGDWDGTPKPPKPTSSAKPGDPTPTPDGGAGPTAEPGSTKEPVVGTPGPGAPDSTTNSGTSADSAYTPDPNSTFKPNDTGLSASGKNNSAEDVSVNSSSIKVKVPVKVKAVIKGRKILLSWKKADGAIKYKIYRSTKKKGKYKALKTVRKVKFIDKKIVRTGKYYYKVKAYYKIDGSTFISGYSKAVKAK